MGGIVHFAERFWRGAMVPGDVIRPTRQSQGARSHRKPATQAEPGREIAALAGGAGALVERARRLAVVVGPANRAAHAARARIYEARAQASPGTHGAGNLLRRGAGVGGTGGARPFPPA